MAHQNRLPINQAHVKSCPQLKKPTKKGCDCKWELKYRDLEKKQHSPRFDTFDQAEEAYKKIMAAKKSGSLLPEVNKNRTFKDVWTEFRNHGLVPLAGTTYKNYDSVYRNHYDSWFGSRMIGGISADDIGKWLDWQKSGPYTPNGIMGRFTLLGSVFNFAVKRQIIPHNPCHAHQSGRNNDTYTPVRPEDVPSAGQVLTIITKLPPALQICGWGMAYQGLRAGEALALCLEEMDLNEKDPILRVAYHLEPSGAIVGDKPTQQSRVVKSTKHRQEHEAREVPIISGFEEKVKLHINTFGTWNDEEWLCESPRYRGQHPSYDYFLRCFQSAVTEAYKGADFTPKSFRHFFVSMCLAEDIPLFDIAKWLGHRDTRTTELVYAHVMLESKRKTRRRLGDRLKLDIAQLAEKDGASLDEEGPGEALDGALA